MGANANQKAGKQRADQLMVDRGLAETRSRAQALIRSGNVFVGERRVDKPGDQLAGDAALELRGREHPFVSRGGMKLARAIERFGLEAEGRVALDIGASTGGFTDVLLRAGARRVYAVDVGYGQLDWSLRNDERVVVLEKTNARALTAELVPEPVDAIVCDASFIGLRTVLLPALALAATGAWLAALIKPQFEAGRADVGKGGVVRDAAVHARVCEEVGAWLAERPGWRVRGIAESPITGPKGNKEFLIVADHGGPE